MFTEKKSEGGPPVLDYYGEEEEARRKAEKARKPDPPPPPKMYPRPVGEMLWDMLGFPGPKPDIFARKPGNPTSDPDYEKKCDKGHVCCFSKEEIEMTRIAVELDTKRKTKLLQMIAADDKETDREKKKAFMYWLHHLNPMSKY